MTTITTTATTTTRRSLGAVLLSRRGAVYLPTTTAQPDVDALAGVALLETDLVERGFLLSAGLRQALTALDTDALATAGQILLTDIDAALGADRNHTPLFRGFPRSTPHDTFALYVDRVLTLLQPDRRGMNVMARSRAQSAKRVGDRVEVTLADGRV
ncbi:hypothetical protein ACWD4N_42475, partial [Streptomyces sp. NPDC002586]